MLYARRPTIPAAYPADRVAYLDSLGDGSGNAIAQEKTASKKA